MAQVRSGVDASMNQAPTIHSEDMTQYFAPTPLCSTHQHQPHLSAMQPILHSNASAHHYNHSRSQITHLTDISYPESYLRTPIYALPFPHPKWHVKVGTGEAYEVTSPIWEEYDAELGYVNSVGEVRESIESRVGDEGDKENSVEKGTRRGKRRLDDISEMCCENVKRKRFRDA